MMDDSAIDKGGRAPDTRNQLALIVKVNMQGAPNKAAAVVIVSRHARPLKNDADFFSLEPAEACTAQAKAPAPLKSCGADASSAVGPLADLRIS